MDRLSTLIGCLVASLVAVAACEDTKPSGDPPSRVNASKDVNRRGTTTESFCDVHSAAGKGPAMTWPALTSGAPPPASSSWRWVNAWATWCKPCVEEMPRLAKWRDKLAAGGKKLELVFVSVDEDEADVTKFRKLYPEAPPSTRLVDGSQSAAWFKELGLVRSPTLPVHFFVGPDNRVRCARSGSVSDQDYAVVEKLLAE